MRPTWVTLYERGYGCPFTIVASRVCFLVSLKQYFSSSYRKWFISSLRPAPSPQASLSLCRPDTAVRINCHHCGGCRKELGLPGLGQGLTGCGGPSSWSPLNLFLELTPEPHKLGSAAARYPRSTWQATEIPNGRYWSSSLDPESAMLLLQPSRVRGF